MRPNYYFSILVQKINKKVLKRFAFHFENWASTLLHWKLLQFLILSAAHYNCNVYKSTARIPLSSFSP